MPLLHIEKRDEIALIAMNRPPGNALSLEMMSELAAAHRRLANDPKIRAVILRSEVASFFCEGLDPRQLLGDLPSRPGVTPLEAKRVVFQKFFDLISELYAFKKLQFALIEGHAIAGGAVLAALCDFRGMSLAPGRIQFSEVKIGLGIPPALLELLSQTTGRRTNRALLAAEAFKAREAFEAGLVDMLFEPGQAESATISFIKRLLRSPDASFQETKAAIRAPILNLWARNKGETLTFIERFFNEAFDHTLSQLVKKRKDSSSIL